MPKENKPEVTDEQEQLDQLNAAAEAARKAGVYDPNELEGGA